MKKNTYTSPTITVTRFSLPQILAGSEIKTSDKTMDNASSLSVDGTFFEVDEDEENGIW